MGIDGREIKREKEQAERILTKATPKQSRGTTKETRKDSSTNKFETSPNKKTELPSIFYGGIALILIVGVGFAAFSSFFLSDPTEKKAAPKASKASTIKSREPGKITQGLGEKTVSFGSQNQAKELLAIINAFKDKTEYQISYSTPEDIVIFGCDFSKDVLVRMHDYRNGHGKVETWSGYILYRLEMSAAGNSLNDTPNGKIYAHNSSF